MTDSKFCSIISLEDKRRRKMLNWLEKILYKRRIRKEIKELSKCLPMAGKGGKIKILKRLEKIYAVNPWFFAEQISFEVPRLSSPIVDHSSTIKNIRQCQSRKAAKALNLSKKETEKRLKALDR
jgi:hypothetical protein